MGSGVGITLYGTHRVAGERYRFAMPEAGIGLFPDDGVSWVLAQLPDEIGMYLALTGRSVGRADAYRLGLVTHCIPAARFAEIRRAVADADPVDPVLDTRGEDPGPGELETLRETIARCFAADSVEGVVARLEAERGAEQAWAEGVLADLRRCSPTSLKVTHRHVRLARQLDLRATLAQDYRLACRFMENHDFYEGVRAALVDRDQQPQWRPGRLSDVSEAPDRQLFRPTGRRGAAACHARRNAGGPLRRPPRWEVFQRPPSPAGPACRSRAISRPGCPLDEQGAASIHAGEGGDGSPAPASAIPNRQDSPAVAQRRKAQALPVCCAAMASRPSQGVQYFRATPSLIGVSWP